MYTNFRKAKFNILFYIRCVQSWYESHTPMGKARKKLARGDEDDGGKGKGKGKKGAKKGKKKK